MLGSITTAPVGFLRYIEPRRTHWSVAILVAERHVAIVDAGALHPNALRRGIGGCAPPRRQSSQKCVRPLLRFGGLLLCVCGLPLRGDRVAALHFAAQLRSLFRDRRDAFRDCHFPAAPCDAYREAEERDANAWRDPKPWAGAAAVPAEVPDRLTADALQMLDEKERAAAHMSAFDPKQPLAVRCGNGFDAGFSPYQSARLSGYDAVS
jgi:hypothetical protein